MPRRARKRDDLLCVSIPFPSSSLSFARSLVRSLARSREGVREQEEKERERERKKKELNVYTHEEMFLLLVLPLYIYIFYITYTLFSIIPIDRNPLLYYVVIVSAISEPFVMVAVDEHARHICRPRSYQRSFSACSPFHRRSTFHFQLFLIPSAAEKDWE
mgnify:CR=1 FL=1